MLPSDLTALVFSNLLWFLLTLCIGSHLVTRPYRPEHAGQGRRGTASGSLGAHGRSVSAADKLAADELVVEPLAALPPVDWSADTLPSRRPSVWPRSLTRLVPAGLSAPATEVAVSVPAGAARSLMRHVSGSARHRRPRPAREKLLAQAAAVAIGVVMAGAAIGLGLHMASGGGHASAILRGGLAAKVSAGTAPPVITGPTTPHATTPAHTTSQHARRADSRSVASRGRLRTVSYLGPRPFCLARSTADHLPGG